MTDPDIASHFQNLPIVSRESLRAVVHDLATDPTYRQRVFRHHNNRNNDLMSGVVVAANEHAYGDMGLQDSFVKGAEYVLAALQREIDSDYLEELWKQEQVIELQGIQGPPQVS